jgi:hypothetical protein
MTKRLICAALASLCISISAPAFAEIEKLAIPGGQGLQLYWWPKLPELAGWKHDRDISFEQGANVLLPEGATVDNAKAVIFAKASYKERMPEVKTLDQFIANHVKVYTSRSQGGEVKDAPPLKSADGREFISKSFASKAVNSWDRVSFLEEGDFYLAFIVFAQSPEDLAKAMPAYETLISKYKEKP